MSVFVRQGVCVLDGIASWFYFVLGLMGANSIEELKIDELQEVNAELFNKHLMKVYFEEDESKKVRTASHIEYS